jgi:hypothetical protein
MCNSQDIISTWTPLAAVVIALIGVITAILSLRSQIKRAKFSQSVDLLLKFEDRFFNTEQMKTARLLASKSLQQGGDSGVDDVLDFFETIGMLIRKDALDKEMVWNTFFYWLHRYWSAARDYISSQREDDPATWQELTYLHERMIEVERKKTHCSDSDLRLSKEDIKKFLEEEASLQ